MNDQSAAVIPTQDRCCLNCGVERVGLYCQDCGQHARAPHRSVRRLGAELVLAFTESDGPLLRSIRRLAFDPGRLTRDYLAGKQASQVSPVRLFLFALAVFLVIADHNVIVQMGNPTAAQLQLVPPWLRAPIKFADAHGLSFLDAMHSSAELFALLTFPIAAVLLKLVYFNRRAITLYDHAVTAGYSLSFQLVMMAIIVSLPDPAGDFVWVPFLAMSVHLFAQLRGVYGGSVVLTVLRMASLAMLSVFAFAVLFICWLVAAGLIVTA